MILYLEDLTAGMRFSSPAHMLDAEAIKAFASAFDPQPFHTDETAAAETFFSGLAASGWHTAAITMRLLTQSLPFAGGVIGAGGEIAWNKPVRPGDTLQVESEILQLTPSRTRPERGMGLLRCETRNQHGEVVQVFTCKVVLQRRPV
jgi:acyl dehydratase